MPRLERLVDGDAFLTKDNFIFTVIGYEHPENRYFCFLKYIPAELKQFFPIRFLKRTWKLRKEEVTLYRAEKLYTAENYRTLITVFKTRFPKYVYFCRYRKKEIISVPASSIKKTFSAQECLEKLLAKKNKDKLEALAVELLTFLSDFAHVPLKDFGLRGSIALDMHTDESDIDFAVYGAQNFRRVEKTLKMLAEKDEIHYITSRKIDFQRKFRGKYKNKVFMYNAVRKPEEIDTKYGEHVYTPIKTVSFECKVVDDSESMFRPAIYKIAKYRPLNEESKLERSMVPEKVVSMIGCYRNIARKEQKIRVLGMLERVESLQKAEVFYQVVVGSGTVDNEYIAVQ